MSTSRNVRFIYGTIICMIIKISQNYTHDHIDYYVHFNAFNDSDSPLYTFAFIDSSNEFIHLKSIQYIIKLKFLQNLKFWVYIGAWYW